MASSGIFGNLIGGIVDPIVGQEDPDIQGKYYDPAYGQRLLGTFGDWDKLQPNSRDALAAFTKKYSALTPRLDALAGTDVDYLSALLKKSAERAPIADYKDILNFQFDKIGGVSNRFKDSGSARVKLNAANLGLANRGTNYLDLQLAANQQANIAPLYSQALATAPGVYGSTIEDYYRNLSTVPGLMNQRYNLLESTAGRELVPLSVERANLSQNLDLLNKIGSANRDAQYFWRRPSDLETYGKIGSNALDTALSVYSGGVSSLGKGGGMGSGGGRNSGGVNLSQISSLFGNQGGGQPQGWNWWSGMNGQAPAYGNPDNPIARNGGMVGPNYDGSTLGGGMNWLNQGGGSGGGGM